MWSLFVKSSAVVSAFRDLLGLNSSAFGKKLWIILIILLIPCFCFCQVNSLNGSLRNPPALPYQYLTKQEKTKRQIFIGAVNVIGYGGSLIILNNTWYKNYPHTSFHTFNDFNEWLQVDKFGHAWTAYSTGRVSAAMWRWAGLSPTKATLIGGLSGTLYLTVVEFLDGHSAQWGWSWGDMCANLIGSGLFISQELIWKEQMIQPKFSFHRND